MPTTSSKFNTFSQFKQSSTELNDLVESATEKCQPESKSYALIGLHSCGNLSNSIINLYLKSAFDLDCSKRSRLLCNVACCYNLLDEKYTTNNPMVGTAAERDNGGVQVDETSKFSMSAFLNEKRYALSFNIRMLACHSLEKCLASIDDFREVSFNLSIKIIYLLYLFEQLLKASNNCGACVVVFQQ
jgi:hypothetical protein